MLDHVNVEAYGVTTPLKRIASVVLRDSQTLGVNLHDPNVRIITVFLLSLDFPFLCLFPP